MTSIKDVNIYKKRLLIRVDFNVPIKNNKILSYERIDMSLPTIKYAIKNKAYVMIMSHLGRPKEGFYEKRYSLSIIVNYLSKKLNVPVHLISNYIEGNVQLNCGELFLLENVRFNIGEKLNNEILSIKYSNLCDVFVMEAFGVAHRKEASNYGIIKHSKKSCLGFLFDKEIKSIKKIFKNSSKPITAIIGGAKISTKISLIESLISKVNNLIVGGGIANTLLVCKGFFLGKSIFEKYKINKIKKIIDNVNLLLPCDLKVYNLNSKLYSNKLISDIKKNDQALDIGKKTINEFCKIIKMSKTVIWNGPLGKFEDKNCCLGSYKLLKSITENKNIYSVVGGGDTIAVLEKFNLKNKISYVSTGGGSFLKFISNEELPVVSELRKYSI
ncbi:MAG: phosphoglycerate kinase [Enterobacteriaceae bacterium]